MRAVSQRSGRVSIRLVGAYFAFVLGILGLIELQPKPGGDAAIVTAPWSAPGRAALIAAAADGDFVSATRFSFVLIAHPRSAHFTATAYAKGAWLVFDAGLLAGCRPQNDAAATYKE
jgi:hypothetical protein